MVSVDVKHHVYCVVRAQELCESRGGRPGLPVPNKPTVSADVKQHSTSKLCGLSYKSPREIKRRKVSWAVMKSWTIFCGSRRDQEEGGGVRTSREPR